MTLGQKIKKLRIEKNLTQKDLADKVYVTFQTVSKWEKDENEPDVATLRKLAQLFGCSMDYLLNEEETEPNKKEQPPKTIIIRENNLHVCERCNKDIPSEELCVVRATGIPSRRGQQPRTIERFYHKTCYEELKKEIELKNIKYAKERNKRAKKVCFGWAIPFGIIAFVGTLIALLMVPACRNIFHPAVAVVLAILAGYAIFADLYCIISGSYVFDVFTGVSTWSIKLPGLIFSWSIDGFIWLIAMKILFAILGFLIGVAAVTLAVGISAVLSMFSFPFVLVHNIHTQYADYE